MRRYLCCMPLAMALGLPVPAPAAQCTAASGGRRVALIELYTSEGCYSCPPTDHWVSGLPARGFTPDRLVVLGFHVDYWNQLGWIDPFAQQRFSERQRTGSLRNHARFVYTPQLLLDGRDYRRGLLRDDLSDRITAVNRRAPGATITLTLAQSTADELTVSGTYTVRDATARNTARAYLALYENDLSNRIAAGENRGKTLRHDFVVRELAGPFPVATGAATTLFHRFHLDHAWKQDRLFAAAFVQDEISGTVLQALAMPDCARAAIMAPSK